ncbi:hypothetical protein MCHI_000611 [Candidatus Magnetoovum chiemensis]|nr:hypothetical protein MCHI_000611 [Candidatus Magnetoovum chiemensis]
MPREPFINIQISFFLLSSLPIFLFSISVSILLFSIYLSLIYD